MGDEVLVTGAAGFIGRHVAAACAAAGWQVTTLDQREAGPEVTGQADFWRTDLADARVLRAIRRGRFAAVLHLAGISSTVKDDWAVLERTNVTGPIRLGRRVRGVRRPFHLRLLAQRLRADRRPGARGGERRRHGVLGAAQPLRPVQAPAG